MDPFVHLPNEVLQEVFKHVPSLPALFKLAAVSQKFRGGALKIIHKSMPLHINFQHQTINGFNSIPHNSWPEAVEVLVKRSRFNDIRFRGSCPEAILETILNILIGSDHLNEVKTFLTVQGTNSSVLEQLLAKCDQLHQLDLDFPLSRFPNPNARALDLTTVLSNKALHVLSLRLDVYPVQDLSAAFKSLAPNTLRRCLIQIDHPLDLVQLLREVPAGVWSALTALDLVIDASNDPQLGLFEIVARMPLLRNSTIICTGEGHEVTVPFHQFADAVILLFNNHHARTNKLMISQTDSRLRGTSGCAVFNLVRVLLQNHPGLQVQYNAGAAACKELQFTLGNIALTWDIIGVSYCDAVCLECRSFYPDVVLSLLVRAEQTLTNGHLHDHRLDRCKIERVVQDYNTVANMMGESSEAVSAMLNEAQDQATVTVEIEGHGQFNITVDCDRCLINSCVACWVQD